MTIPDRVRDAATRARDNSPPLTPEVASGELGEVDLAAAPDGQGTRRLVAIVGHNEAMKIVTIQLASEMVEAASDLDMVLSPAESELPFALVIQTELYGPVFLEQLQFRLGQLTEEQRIAVSEALISDGESLEGFGRGIPLAGPDDPRRAYKENELDDLEGLVEDCRRWLEGGAAKKHILDPELILPPPPGTPIESAIDRFLELLDALDAMGADLITVPSEFLALFSEAQLLDDIARWRTEFGFDAGRVLSRVRITEDEGEAPRLTDSDRTLAGQTARGSRQVMAAYLAGQADSGLRAVDIQTVRRCWDEDEETVVVESRLGRFCRGRAQWTEAA